VRFGLQVGRFDAGASNVIAGCHVSAQVGNRNGTTTPLDPDQATTGLVSASLRIRRQAVA